MAQNLADVRLNDPSTPSSVPPASEPVNPFSVNAKKSAPAAESTGAVPSTSTAAAAATDATDAAASAPPQREVKALESQDKSASGSGAQTSASLSDSQPAENIPVGVGSVQSQSGRSSRSSSEETDAEGWMVVDSQCVYRLLVLFHIHFYMMCRILFSLWLFVNVVCF